MGTMLGPQHGQGKGWLKQLFRRAFVVISLPLICFVLATLGSPGSPVSEVGQEALPWWGMRKHQQTHSCQKVGLEWKLFSQWLRTSGIQF